MISSFPEVIRTFEVPARDGDRKKYRLEILQADRFEEVLDIMKDKHLLDEPMYSSKGVRHEPVSLQEMIGNWKNMLAQNISLICFEEGSTDIVAVNILGVVTEAEFKAEHTVSNDCTILFQTLTCHLFKVSRQRMGGSEQSEEAFA